MNKRGVGAKSPPKREAGGKAPSLGWFLGGWTLHPRAPVYFLGWVTWVSLSMV